MARVGIRCSNPADLDAAIMEMIDYPGPVIFDCLVDKDENCFPMIPSGKAHNEMLMLELGDDAQRYRLRHRRKGQDAGVRRRSLSFAPGG